MNNLVDDAIKRYLIEQSRIHHSTTCNMCIDDASRYNHCGFCGHTSDPTKGLNKHLNGPCTELALGIGWPK